MSVVLSIFQAYRCCLKEEVKYGETTAAPNREEPTYSLLRPDETLLAWYCTVRTKVPYHGPPTIPVASSYVESCSTYSFSSWTPRA